jgi:hypothetical protein
MLRDYVANWREVPGMIDEDSCSAIEILESFLNSWDTARMPRLLGQLDESDIQVAPPVKGNISMLGKAKLSVVQVVNSEGSGSGVVLSALGTIATNHHVVEGHLGGCSVIHPETKEKVRVDVFETFPGWDIAILKPRASEKQQAWQPMQVNPQTPQGGEEVWALGYPLGFGYTVNKGVLSGISVYEELPHGLSRGRYDDNSMWLRTDCPINPGNSGGPLIDGRGQLLGLNTWKPIDQRHVQFDEVYFAVSVQHVISAWKAVSPNVKAGAGLTSLMSAGSFSAWGEGLREAYKSRVDVLQTQKEQERLEVQLKLERANEKKGEVASRTIERFDYFCELAREEIRGTALKAAEKAIEEAELQVDLMDWAVKHPLSAYLLSQPVVLTADPLGASDKAAIIARLESTHFAPDFKGKGGDGAELIQVAAFLQDVTGVNFVVSTRVVEDLDEDETMIRLTLSERSVVRVLDNIAAEQERLDWMIEDGCVKFVASHEVGQRQPQWPDPKQITDPEDVACFESLHSTPSCLTTIKTDDLKEVMSLVQEGIGIPIFVDEQAWEVAVDEGVLFDFDLTIWNQLAAVDLISLITRQAGEKVSWTIKHGVVFITGSPNCEDYEQVAVAFQEITDTLKKVRRSIPDVERVDAQAATESECRNSVETMQKELRTAEIDLESLALIGESQVETKCFRTITKFLRAELDRKEKADTKGSASRWGSLIKKFERIVDGEDCRDQEGILLNAYAAFYIVELRHNVYELYEKQYIRGGRKNVSLWDKANREAEKAKEYLGLLKRRFPDEVDEKGKNLLSRANEL